MLVISELVAYQTVSQPTLTCVQIDRVGWTSRLSIRRMILDLTFPASVEQYVLRPSYFMREELWTGTSREGLEIRDEAELWLEPTLETRHGSCGWFGSQDQPGKKLCRFGSLFLFTPMCLSLPLSLSFPPISASFDLILVWLERSVIVLLIHSDDGLSIWLSSTQSQRNSWRSFHSCPMDPMMSSLTQDFLDSQWETWVSMYLDK